eukprot:gene10789-19588_t
MRLHKQFQITDEGPTTYGQPGDTIFYLWSPEEKNARKDISRAKVANAFKRITIVISSPTVMIIQMKKAAKEEVSLERLAGKGIVLLDRKKEFVKRMGTGADLNPNAFRALIFRAGKSRRVYCSVPKTLKNGRINGNSVAESSILNYECDKNFEITGPTSRVCQSNARWSQDDPFCEPKYCTHPGKIPNGVALGSVLLAGYSLRFVCNPGFTLVGEKTIKCQKGGSWDALPPRCILEDEALKVDAQRLKKTFVNRLKLLTVDGRGRSAGFSSAARGIDLIFLIDVSDSVGRKNFERSLDFVESMVEYFGISSSEKGTHVALIVFANEAKIIFNLKDDRVYEKKIAKEELANLKFSGGGTGTRLALDTVRLNVLPQTRKFAKKVLFLITDGNYNIGGDPAPNAKVLRDDGVEIFTVGVSGFVSREGLEELASLPFQRHIWMIKDYEMFGKLKKLVNESFVDYTSCGQGGNTKSKTPKKTADITDHGAWPWVVTVEVDGETRCAGILVDASWVLTAASCLKSAKPANVYIVAGLNSRNNFTGSEQRRGIRKFFISQRKDASAHLAMLKVEKKVELNEYARTVCFPDEYDNLLSVRPFKNAFVVGWGTKENPYLEQRQGYVEIIGNTRCKEATRRFKITENHICVKAASSGDAACAASVGSPLLIQRSRTVGGRRAIYSWFLAGVVQKNRGCHGRKFTVLTNIYKAKTWIEDVIKNE